MFEQRGPQLTKSYAFLSRSALSTGALGLALISAPAFAQEEPAGPVTVTGSVGLVSDYRFRGVSQSDRGMAIQGGLTATHESGVYVGTWGSNLSGWGTFGGASSCRARCGRRQCRALQKLGGAHARYRAR